MRPSSLSARRLRSFAIVVALTTAAHAQDPQQPHDPPPYILRVYNNLVQFPTIVLSADYKPLPPIPREKFALTIDGGPVFHPTQMRLEGDDPLALTVLLDAGGYQTAEIQDFAEAFAHLIPTLLHPRDHLSIYALDCRLIRSAHDVPANVIAVRNGVANVLSAPPLHDGKPKPQCGNSLHLWDAMNVIGNDLADQPARRVVLVVSIGFEARSKSSLSETASFVGGHGIAVFALRDGAEWREHLELWRSTGVGNLSAFNNQDALEAFCAQTGGMVLYTSRQDLQKSLENFVAIVRGRYVLEFPRPDDAASAHHVLVVKVTGTEAFIRPTGATSPIADAAIMNDPNTIPSPPSPAKVGKHHPSEKQ